MKSVPGLSHFWDCLACPSVGRVCRPLPRNFGGYILSTTERFHMRRFLLILLIALLPIRGFAGGVMAVEMSTQALNAINLIAGHAYPSGDSGLFDGQALDQATPECPGHAQAASGVAAHSHDTQPTTDDHCKNCSVCQICNSLAIAGSVAIPAGLLPAQSPKPAIGVSFASAALATSLKPPIS